MKKDSMVNDVIKKPRWNKTFMKNEFYSFLIGVALAVYTALLLSWYQTGPIWDALLLLFLLYVGVKFAHSYSKRVNNKGKKVVNETSLVTFILLGAILSTKFL